jgi:hypothetical protein
MNMEHENIERTLALAREGTKEWDDAMARGRALIDAATQAVVPAQGIPALRQAGMRFQSAIRINKSKDEAYGWLARAYRLLAQATRERNADISAYYLRCASAVAWEAKTRTQAAALSVFTKQEIKTLLAWVRMSKRLDPTAGEAEMDALRAEFLTPALDPDTIAETPGG